MSVYTQVVDDSFARADTQPVYGPGSTMGAGNGWRDNYGGNYPSIASNKLSVSGGAISLTWIVRQPSESMRDSAIAVYAAPPSAITVGSGCVLRAFGLQALNYGYLGYLDGTGTPQIAKVIASTSTNLHSGTALSSPVLANGFVHLFSAVNTSPTSVTLTYSVFYASGGSNVYTGNPAAPGTPLQTITVTDASAELVGRAGVQGICNTGTDPTKFTRATTYSVYGTLGATTSGTPKIGQKGVTVSLTGVGTSWTSGTTFTLSGGSGASIVSQKNNSATSQTLVVDMGNAPSTLTITDPTNSATTTIFPSAATYYIATIGDSIMADQAGPIVYGYNTQPAQAMAIALSKRQPLVRDIIGHSFGVSGSYTNDWITPTTSNELAQIVAFNPDIITVLLGANDVINAVAIATSMANMQTILNYLVANTTSKIVVFPCLYQNFNANSVNMPAYNAQLPNLTYVSGRSYFADSSPYAYFRDNLSEINSDLLHPNISGVWSLGEIMAEGVSSALFDTKGFANVANGSSSTFTFPIEGFETYARFLVNVDFGAVSATSGVQLSVQTSTDGITYAQYPLQVVVPAIANQVVNEYFLVDVRGPLKKVPGSIRFMRITATNLDANNNVAATVIQDANIA